MMNKVEVIENYLDELLPDAHCELNYHKDYELVIAVMLSAQTTDKRVNKVTSVLFTKYPSLEDLRSANLQDVSNIVHELGSYTKKAQAVIAIANILVDKYQGKVPNKRKDLESLPMVGRKTANVVLSEYFKVPNIAVDTHVNRVSKRLGLAKESDDVLEVEAKLKRKFKREDWNKRHHQLVLFGRYYCKAIAPLCDNCKLKSICKWQKEKAHD